MTSSSNFIHFCDFAVLFLQLNVSFKQLSDSVRFQRFQTFSLKAKVKCKKVVIAVTYLAPMLPPGGRNWQLIYLNYSKV